MRNLASQIDSIRVLTQAGLLRPSRPSRMVGALMSVAQWGLTPASGYAAAAHRFGDEPAIIDDLGVETFAELDRRTDAIAAGLRAAGVDEGDRVGLMARNHRYFVESILALAKVGADALLFNTAFAAAQLTAVASREGARAVVYDAEFAPLFIEAGKRRKRFVAWSDDAGPSRLPLLDELAADHDGARVDPPSRRSRFVILTSGTTGTPKGASRPTPAAIDPLLAYLSRVPLRSRETMLIGPPLFHALGLGHMLFSSVLASTLILQRRFDAEATLTAAAQHGAHSMIVVPVMLQRFLDVSTGVRLAHRPSRLRVVLSSGSALSGPLATRFMDAYGDLLYNLYGSTECAWASIATPAELRAAPGTVGRTPRGVTVRIVDAQGDEVPTGGVGRIFVGSDLLFEGYTTGGDKERLGGLASTGDLGRVDEQGMLFVEGRDDDMIVSGGENVFPAEVEDLLNDHRAIAEAAVVGVPDEEFGQRLAAFVVLRQGATLSADDVRTHVRGQLARYKVPRDVVFVVELPRNPTGKVLKRVLVEEHA